MPARLSEMSWCIMYRPCSLCKCCTRRVRSTMSYWITSSLPVCCITVHLLSTGVLMEPVWIRVYRCDSGIETGDRSATLHSDCRTSTGCGSSAQVRRCDGVCLYVLAGWWAHCAVVFYYVVAYPNPSRLKLLRQQQLDGVLVRLPLQLVRQQVPRPLRPELRPRNNQILPPPAPANLPLQ